jgi:hypothetical protein
MDFSWTTIIIVILLIIIVYFVWTMLSSSSSSTTSVTQEATTKSQLTVTSSNSFAFSIWIYVSSWTTSTSGMNKQIITTAKGANYFNLSLGDSDNGLHATVGGQSMLVIPNIPLQTWALITANVNNGNSLDIYINGKLVQTTALDNPFQLDAGSVDVGGPSSFTGFIFATFTNSPVGPQDVWNTYSSGYGSGGGSSVSDFFNKYKIRFAFVKDNVELSKLDI